MLRDAKEVLAGKACWSCGQPATNTAQDLMLTENSSEGWSFSEFVGRRVFGCDAHPVTSQPAATVVIAPDGVETTTWNT